MASTVIWYEYYNSERELSLYILYKISNGIQAFLLECRHLLYNGNITCQKGLQYCNASTANYSKLTSSFAIFS